MIIAATAKPKNPEKPAWMNAEFMQGSAMDPSELAVIIKVKAIFLTFEG